jgi:hypothetical protein
MFANIKTRKITIMNKIEFFDIKIREDVSIKTLKDQISKYLNLSFDHFYLFYNEQNLLESFNDLLIKEFLLDESDTNSDNLFYMINKEEYISLQNSLKFPKCIIHKHNIAYLICFKDDEFICDKCREEEPHKNHKEVSDQALILESYFMKLNQFEKNLDKMLNKISEEEMNSICEEMKKNLKTFQNSEIKNYDQILDSLKKNVSKSQELEGIRFNNLISAGRDKILAFEGDAKILFDLFKQLKEKNSIKQTNFVNFQKKQLEEKLELLTIVQNQNIDLINKSVFMKNTLEKIRNIGEYDISTLLDLNKDNSFFITFSKLKQILDTKLLNIEKKSTKEDTDKLLNYMNLLKSNLNLSKFYNRFLNLDNINRKLIIQPLDESLKINIFDIEQKKLYLESVNLLPNNEGFASFPKYGRSINIKGNVYITGGEISGGLVNFFIEIDYLLNCRVLKGMDFKRSGHNVVNINNSKIVVISGAYGEKSCEYFDFEKNCWYRLPNINIDRVGSSALVYNSEEIFCFFGKNYDIAKKNWNFVNAIEKINLVGKYPQWEIILLKNKFVNFNNKKSFASFVTFPSDKILIIGGQVQNDDGEVCPTNEILELDFKSFIINPYYLKIPRPAIFNEPNFYLFNTNCIQFDNSGSIFFYSMVFDEFHFLENY